MSKVYHHRTPGAKFYMPDGKEICFNGGHFDSAILKDTTTRIQVERELDKVANVPSSQIFTTETPVIGHEEGDVVKEIRSSATASFDAAHNIKDGTTVEIPVAKPAQPIISQAPSGAAPSANKAVEAAREALKKAEEAKNQAGPASSS